MFKKYLILPPHTWTPIPPDAASYSSFANGLKSLETSVSNNDNLSTTEKKTLLATCAVGRYSADHWANCLVSSPLCMIKKNNQDNSGYDYYYSDPRLSGPNNPCENYIFHSNLQVKIWPKWLRRVLADVAGAITGISGGLVGIVGGAVGTTLLEVITEHSS